MWGCGIFMETIDLLAETLFESNQIYTKDKCRDIAETVYDVLAYDYRKELDEKGSSLLLIKDLNFDSLDFTEMVFFLEENLDAVIPDPLFHRYRDRYRKNLSVLHVLQMCYEAKFE